MHIDDRYRIISSEIEDCILHQKNDFYIYPFGAVGNQVKNILNNRYGIIEKGIIDNKLSHINDRVMDISDLKEDDMTEKAIILISSEDASIMQSVVKSLPSFIKSNQISFALNNIWEDCLTDNMSFDIFYKHCKIGKRTTRYKSFLTPFSLAESIGRYCNINYTARAVLNHSLDFVSAHGGLLEYKRWDSDDDYQKKCEYIKKYGKYTDNCWACFEKTTSKNPPIRIGNDVWIGQNVLILPGTTIHDGAVCAAGAVVTHDVPPYTIVGGVPAKPIRKRFPDDTIQRLLKIQWWNWSEEKIQNNLEFFYQPEKFVEMFLN